MFATTPLAPPLVKVEIIKPMVSSKPIPGGPALGVIGFELMTGKVKYIQFI